MKINSRMALWLSSTAVVLAGLVVAPGVEAARGGGHGGGGHGGGSRPHADDSRADKRTTNVRNTSVNNVNVNRNVNVSVDNNRGCCNNGWDDDFHPVATAAAVTATVAVTSAIVGSIVRTVPPGCVPVSYGGMVYQQCAGTWYQPQGTQYIVVNPPY